MYDTILTPSWVGGTNPDGTAISYFQQNAYPIASVTPPTGSFGTYTGSFGPHELNAAPATTAYCKIVFLNCYYAAGAKAQRVSGVKIYEKTNATALRISNVATGARVDITDAKIRVYDSSNVCRVKIGDLA
jgi:hypothetical protein